MCTNNTYISSQRSKKKQRASSTPAHSCLARVFSFTKSITFSISSWNKSKRHLHQKWAFATKVRSRTNAQQTFQLSSLPTLCRPWTPANHGRKHEKDHRVPSLAPTNKFIEIIDVGFVCFGSLCYYWTIPIFNSSLQCRKDRVFCSCHEAHEIHGKLPAWFIETTRWRVMKYMDMCWTKVRIQAMIHAKKSLRWEWGQIAVTCDSKLRVPRNRQNWSYSLLIAPCLSGPQAF